MLDDRSCARLWAEHWSRRGYAWIAIQQRLMRQGLGEGTIHAAARIVGGRSNDEDRARRVLADATRRPVDSAHFVPSTCLPVRGSRPAAFGARQGGVPSRVEGRRTPAQHARIARTLAARGFDADLIEHILSESADFLPPS